MLILGVLIAMTLLLAAWGIAVYNRLVRLSNQKEEGWSGIDVQLKRRFDLVPNLVETVKGYATHEKETLQRVIEARSAISHAGSQESRMDAENMLTTSLRSLFAVVEQYPDLKANNHFSTLQGELSNLESELQMARRYYNGTAREFNNAVQAFPAVLIAAKLGYQKAPFFSAEEEVKATPKVTF